MGASARFLEAYRTRRDVLVFEVAALLRWSSRLEPGRPAAVARRLDLARERQAR